MADKLIELVPRGTIDNVAELTAELKLAKEQLIDTANSAALFTTNIGNVKTVTGYTNAVNAANDELVAFQKNVDLANAALQKKQAAEEAANNKYLVQLSKEQAARDAAEQKQIAADARQAIRDKEKADRAKVAAEKQSAREKIAAQRDDELTAKKVANQAKIDAAIAKSNEAFPQLLKTYQDSKRETENLAASQGRLSKAYLDSNTKTKGLKTEIDEIRKGYGDNTGAVGKYENALSRLGGILTSRVFRLAATFLITDLVIKGTEVLYKYIEAYQSLSRIVGDSISNLKNLNDVNKEADEQYGKQITNLKILYTAATDVNNSMHERILAAQELKREFPAEFKNASDLNIINGALAATYKDEAKNLLDLAKAQAVANKLSEIAGKQADIAFEKQKITNARFAQLGQVKGQITGADPSQSNYGGYSSIAIGTGQGNISVEEQKKDINAQADLAQHQQDLQNAALQRQADFLTKYAGGNNKIASALDQKDSDPKTPKAKGEKEGLDEQLSIIRDAEQKILDDENSTYDQRLAAVSKFQTDSNSLIKKGFADKVITQNAANKLLSGIALDGLKDVNRIEKEANDAFVKSANAGLKQLNEQYENQLTKIKSAGVDELAAIDDTTNKKLRAKAKEYEEGKISEAKYQADIALIKRQGELNSIASQIGTARAVLKSQQDNDGTNDGTGASAEDLKKEADDKKNLADLLKKYDDEVTKNSISDIDLRGAALKNVHDLELQLANTALDQLKDIGDKIYANEVERYKKQASLLQNQADAQKEAVQNGVGSEKQKNAQIALINAQAQQQQAQLQEKENQAKRKADIVDKIAAEAKIIEAEAVAEVQALSYLSNPLTAPFYPAIAALIAATSSISEAAIAAAPVAQYWTGTPSSKSGLAWVGERGTELMIDPSGAMALTPSVPTLTNLKGGTEIINNVELNRMVNSGSISDERIVKELQALRKGNTSHNTILTENGLRGYTKSGATRTEYLRRNGINR